MDNYYVWFIKDKITIDIIRGIDEVERNCESLLDLLIKIDIIKIFYVWRK